MTNPITKLNTEPITDEEMAGIRDRMGMSNEDILRAVIESGNDVLAAREATIAELRAEVASLQDQLATAREDALTEVEHALRDSLHDWMSSIRADVVHRAIDLVNALRAKGAAK